MACFCDYSKRVFLCEFKESGALEPRRGPQVFLDSKNDLNVSSSKMFSWSWYSETLEFTRHHYLQGGKLTFNSGHQKHFVLDDWFSCDVFEFCRLDGFMVKKLQRVDGDC